MWNVLRDRGYIYKGVHEGWYCQADEAFIPETQLVKQTKGSPDDDNFVTSSGHSVEWVSEENYMFALSVRTTANPFSRGSYVHTIFFVVSTAPKRGTQLNALKGP